MLEINQIIKELLQLHDCVILPNLGGFVAQYSPANFDEKKSVFSPPDKQILFNKNLKNNDGLLVNAFAQKNNISYEKALALPSSNLMIETSPSLFSVAISLIYLIY